MRRPGRSLSSHASFWFCFRTAPTSFFALRFAMRSGRGGNPQNYATQDDWSVKVDKGPPCMVPIIGAMTAWEGRSQMLPGFISQNPRSKNTTVTSGFGDNHSLISARVFRPDLDRTSRVIHSDAHTFEFFSVSLG